MWAWSHKTTPHICHNNLNNFINLKDYYNLYYHSSSVFKPPPHKGLAYETMHMLGSDKLYLT